MRILVKESGSIIADLAFESQRVPIGSGRDCAVRLPDMRLAPVHGCLIAEEQGQWRFRPENDRATAINGHLSRQEMPIAHGDEIRIGDFTLHIYLGMDERDDKQAVRAVPEQQLQLPPGARTRSRREAVGISAAHLQRACEFAAVLGSARDEAAIMDAVLTEIMSWDHIRACWVCVRRTFHGSIELRQGRTFKGRPFDEPRMFESLATRCLSGGLTVLVPLHEDGEVGALLAAPLSAADGRLGFVYADTRAGSPRFDEADLDRMLVLGRLVGACLQRVQQAQGRMREALSSAEASVVQAIQARLDPRAVPEWDALQLALHRSPGQRHCGDVYDIMPVSNGAAALLVGHVRAQEIHAAISMIEVRTAFRIAVLHSDLPHVVMREFTWLLARGGFPATMDAAVVMIDPRNGAMLHCQAGRIGAVVVSPDGGIRRLDDPSQPALGGPAHGEHATRKGLLGKRETLVMYSPGVLAVCDESGVPFSDSAFVDLLADSFGVSARAALDEAVAEMERFRGGGERPEDVTVLLAHRSE